MINYQKNHTFKSSLVKFLLCFSFLLIITKPSVSEDLNIILIDPSIQCQAQLDVGFKDMFISNENKYLIKININDSRVKTTFNKGGFNFHHLIKGKDAILIVAKKENSDFGLYVVPDIKYPCRGKFTLSEIIPNTSIDSKANATISNTNLVESKIEEITSSEDNET